MTWDTPTIIEDFEPSRTKLVLPISSADDKKTAISSLKRQMIIEYLTDHPSARTAEIAEYLDLKPSRTRVYLADLIAEGIVVSEGENRNRCYVLKR